MSLCISKMLSSISWHFSFRHSVILPFLFIVNEQVNFAGKSLKKKSFVPGPHALHRQRSPIPGRSHVYIPGLHLTHTCMPIGTRCAGKREEAVISLDTHPSS